MATRKFLDETFNSEKWFFYFSVRSNRQNFVIAEKFSTFLNHFKFLFTQYGDQKILASNNTGAKTNTAYKTP